MSAAKRYARAVFELAREEGDLGAWAQRLEVIEEALEAPQVKAILTDRSLPMASRQRAAAIALNGRAGREGDNLAALLVAASRSQEMGQVSEEFERLRDQAEGRVEALVTSAVEMDPGQRQRLLEALASRLHREVRLETRVDPGILGGLVVQLGDRIIDASVRTRLQQLRRRLAPT